MRKPRADMPTSRLEAFSDGVLAIVITIMVLELKVPHGSDWQAVQPLLVVLGSYVMSFVYVGIYWNNHHHLLHATKRVTGGILWANLHLLFWLSLIPFVTGWMGENHFAKLPVATYGVVLLCSALAYLLLERVILAAEPSQSQLRLAIGRDTKGKLSLVMYSAAIAIAFFNRWLSIALFILVALMWLIPDRRIETRVTSE
jgi:uncharacterized membrane protein